jgi:hypothetical protein
MRMEIVEAVLHKIGAVSETEVTKTTLRMLGKDALRPDVRRRLCGPSRFAFFFGRWPPAVTPTPWACCDLHFRLPVTDCTAPGTALCDVSGQRPRARELLD